MISSGFSRTGLKRNHSSTADESDVSISSENDSKKQEKKRMNTVVEDSDMAVQAALDNISKRLDTLATKVDVEQMRDEVKCLTETFMEKLEKLEGRLLDTEVKAEKVESEVKSLKKVNETATGMIKQQDRRIKQNERKLNDVQQYSRRWNLRVFKVPEKEKETAADCTAKVCAIFSDKVGIPITASDIQVAHRTGQRSSTRARPILVRFFDRKKRDSVIISRRNLKNKGYVIGEDLTYANCQVFRKASEHSATMSVWSSNGKILAKVKNSRIVRVNIHTDLDEAFRRAMSGNEMSADEEE